MIVSSRPAIVTVLRLVCSASAASGQNYSFDARRIALGGTGGTPNVASKLVERQRRYKSVLIPVGLVKLLTDIRVYYPNREDFDFSRAVQYSASPLHFVFGRKENITARSLFRDVVHASLQPDLNSCSGFELPILTESEGLMALTWGKTFMMHEGKRSFQGIYVGAGPFLAAKASFDCDAGLERILSGTGNRYIPFASMGVGGGETDELALDIVPDPPERPFSLTWHKSSKGIGLSMDFGVAFVINRWDFGAGVSGVANRIKWRDITEHKLSLVSLFNGTEFVHVKLPRRGLTTQVEMPVTYTGDVSYHRDEWSAYTEYSNGLGGTNFRVGAEYRFGAVELRGAGRYSQDKWYPSAGVGFGVTRNFGIDAALFGTQTFLEPRPHLGVAISLRFDKR